MKKLLKQIGIPLAGMAFAISTASAQPISSLLLEGNNVFEDDSGETIFRSDGAGSYTVVTTGSIQEEDYVLGIFDIPIINGATLTANEFTGLFLFQVGDIVVTDPDGNDAGGPLGPEGTIIFGAAGTTVWEDLTGIDVVTLGANLGFDPTSLALLNWEDPQNNLALINPGANNFTTALDNARDGTLRFGAGLGTAQADDASIDIGDFQIGSPGVSIRGNFEFNFDILHQNFPGWNFSGPFVGSGTNLVENTACCAVQNDAQYAVNAARVPEPATLMLFGAGLLGFSTLRRFRNG